MQLWFVRGIALMLAVLTTACSNSGSGPAPVTVKGRVTKGGKVLEVPAQVGRVQVTFYEVKADGGMTDPNEAIVDASTGSFTVPGSGGKGIPKGKYKVAVHQWTNFPTVDALKNKYSRDNTKIIREVTGDQDIEIDLDKP